MTTEQIIAPDAAGYRAVFIPLIGLWFFACWVSRRQAAPVNSSLYEDGELNRD
jgi:hypothetical protein